MSVDQYKVVYGPLGVLVLNLKDVVDCLQMLPSPIH
jgi:hypothetical protein